MIIVKKKGKTSLLQTVALAHGVSVEEVHYEILATIEAGWNNPNPEKKAKFRAYFGNKAPTPEEFIYCMAKKLKH